MNAPTPSKVLAQARSVYQLISAVQADICKIGIAKDSRNTQGAGYNFRGIDAVYNALSPIMASHGLVILPRMISRQCEERASKSGGALFYVTVEAEFDFVSSEDGSKHTVKTFGEAMDSSDKATNKAMSAAYKYAAFQAFAIPTVGDNDADAHTPEPIGKAEIETAIEKLNSAAKLGLDNLKEVLKEMPESLKAAIPGKTKKEIWDAAEAMGETK
jgi:hypothetical protein